MQKIIFELKFPPKPTQVEEEIPPEQEADVEMEDYS